MEVGTVRPVIRIETSYDGPMARSSQLCDGREDVLRPPRKQRPPGEHTRTAPSVMPEAVACGAQTT